MKLIIMAPRGKMGRLVTKVAAQRNIEIVAGVTAPDRPYIGRDIGEVAGIGSTVGAEVVGSLEDVIDGCDAIIDFSTVEQGRETLKLALKHKKALLTGTTGFTEEDRRAFCEAGSDIPVMLAANTSLQVNVLYSLLDIAAKAIGKTTDIEVVDMHDRNKLDAPSGTAHEIAATLCNALGVTEDAVSYGHHGEGARNDGEITLHSIRGGDWPSSHTVYFIGNGERLELTHHSNDWTCFAEGAVTGADFLCAQKPGVYTMADCLGLK